MTDKVNRSDVEALKPCPNPRCPGGGIKDAKAIVATKPGGELIHEVWCTGCWVQAESPEDWNALLRAPSATPADTEERLREALEPFVKEADRLDPDGPCESIGDSCEIWQIGSETFRRSRITYGDLRRARAALSPKEP